MDPDRELDVMILMATDDVRAKIVTDDHDEFKERERTVQKVVDVAYGNH